MSDPTRYRVADNQTQRTLGGNVLIVDPAGPLVEFSNYARLKYKSECQTEGINAFDNKLREAEALNARLKAECQARQAENSVLAVECDSLKAEVELLTQLNSTLALRYDATNSMLDGCAKTIEEMEAEVERLQSIHSIDSIGIEQLKAEVERLTKAGNLMCRMAGNNQVINRHWKTAKKGVQS